MALARLEIPSLNTHGIDHMLTRHLRYVTMRRRVAAVHYVRTINHRNTRIRLAASTNFLCFFGFPEFEQARGAVQGAPLSAE